MNYDSGELQNESIGLEFTCSIVLNKFISCLWYALYAKYISFLSTKSYLIKKLVKHTFYYLSYTYTCIQIVSLPEISSESR